MTHLSSACLSAGTLLALLLLGAADAAAQATQNYGFNDYDILLRSATDTNHGLGWYGGGKLWNGTNVDGPVLFGYTSGALGISQQGARSTVLTWTAAGQVGIGTSTPGLLLHLRHSSTPGLRLERPVSGGSQIWDLASSGTDFFVRDVTGGNRLPFRIQAGAPGNVLYLSNSGRVGLGTDTPALQLHLTNSDTPAMRMEQTNAGGFTAQTWDIGANEANFFVRDLTGGSRLPFRIRPGAPTSSLDISASGNVGIGTTSPQALLHVAGTAKIDSVYTLEFGAGMSRKDALAGTIGYGNITTDALNIVGAGTAAYNRKIELHTGGGTTVQGGAGAGGTTLRVANGNTPGVRLDQLAAGGWGTQVWDLAGNEANFFVRDVTNGSLLPFRIRPGAPTSSLDVSANGNVGVGTPSPQAKLDVRGNVKISGANTLEFGSGVAGKQAEAGTIGYGNLAADALNIVGAGTSTTDRKVAIYSEGGMTITGNLTLNGVVASSSDARLKTDVRPLAGALRGVQGLQGHRYRFQAGKGPQGEQLGFIAQELEQVYPELVTTGADGLKAVNYAQLTPVLVEALKEQQRQIEQLRAEVAAGQAQLRQQQTQAAAGTAALEARLTRLESLLGARAGK
ncbi:tail fiber domain-containing protein [Hymenobacter sp. 15J16-1T3B]|uniref:tail fiber domain-containing protein n=1 Tax=Hymenobacter sp. 15J16-1T3B TaxID=2886941 RepID=UPI001D10C43A|nr:tail fiber domain-containing protein [Hymenobacter sp. 15J16-1T3B]MCC3156180.1 tail fiber domain-containing protein [Hymenobacter sp. 15J16-1T3B]